METVFDYFIEELIAHPKIYKGKSTREVLETIKYFYDMSGYENLADIEDMSDKERKQWAKEYFGEGD